MKTSRFALGFSYIEVILTVGILLELLSFIIINITAVQKNTTLASVVTTTISDIKSQQIKAMTGATEGRNAADAYGVYFSQSSYTLFHGLVYSPNDPANLTIQLDPSLHFSNVTFANNSLIFSQISGEVVGYSSNADSVDVVNVTDNTKKTILFNRYGAVTSVQ